jgi:hypothetical protein
MTVGENVAFGDVLNMRSDGKLWKGNATSISNMPIMAMALESISANASGVVGLLGYIKNNAWSWSVGGSIFVYTTSGSMIQDVSAYTTGNQVQIIGVATATTIIYFNPNYGLVEIK